MQNKDTPTNNCQEPLDLLFSQMEAEDFGTNHLTKLVKKYPACETTLTENYQLWKDLDTLESPVPRAEMSVDFYKKLNDYTAQNPANATSTNSIWDKLRSWNLNAKPQ